jgi:hypothetical protein
LITGQATDNVVMLAPSGAQGEGTLTFEFDLPDGSIPRHAMFDPATESFILVYCWGTNEVRVHDLGGNLVATVDLGFDPTPALIREGREVFHDASHSLNNNLTCGSCHIDGRTDMLAWDLSDAPYDMKGPLVVQTFKGIDRTAPFHWRGERPQLVDFNVAFAGLLGGTTLDETPGGDFDRFKAFVFSLRGTANPGQDERNLLNDAIVEPSKKNGAIGSAVAGQRDFMVDITLPPFACVECHEFPTATNSDLILEVPSAIAERLRVVP